MVQEYGTAPGLLMGMHGNALILICPTDHPGVREGEHQPLGCHGEHLKPGCARPVSGEAHAGLGVWVVQHLMWRPPDLCTGQRLNHGSQVPITAHAGAAMHPSIRMCRVHHMAVRSHMHRDAADSPDSLLQADMQTVLTYDGVPKLLSLVQLPKGQVACGGQPGQLCGACLELHWGYGQQPICAVHAESTQAPPLLACTSPQPALNNP